jgi:radical SAM protein with 4Fe4S-binding SPASM domain
MISQKPLETLDPYDRIVKKTLDKFIPFKVDWEITYGCNLNCIHCYQTGPTQGKPELSKEKIFSVLDELVDSGCLFITFTGGEVLIRRDFFEIAGYARKKEFAIRIFSNGTLINEDTASRIRELNPLSVEISLYGASASVHESITRISGSFEKTINAFKVLKRRGINTVVKTTFTKDNFLEFDKLKEFAMNIDSQFNFSFTVIPKIDGSKEVIKLRMNEFQLKELFSAQDWLVAGITGGGVQVFEPLCAAGFNSLYISPYGEVFSCVTLREPCGNLQDSSLKDIWQGEFFKKLRSIKFENLKECFRCKLSYYCDRCAGLAWLEQDDLFGHSPNDCTLARVRKQALEKKKGARYGEKEEAVYKAQDSL